MAGPAIGLGGAAATAATPPSALLEHGQYLLDRHGKPADPCLTVVDVYATPINRAGQYTTLPDATPAGRGSPGV